MFGSNIVRPQSVMNLSGDTSMLSDRLNQCAFKREKMIRRSWPVVDDRGEMLDI